MAKLKRANIVMHNFIKDITKTNDYPVEAAGPDLGKWSAEDIAAENDKYQDFLSQTDGVAGMFNQSFLKNETNEINMER